MALQGKQNAYVFLCYVLGTLCLPLLKGHDTELDFHFKLRDTIKCTHGLYENDETSRTYKSVAKEVEGDVQAVFNVTTNKYYNDFISCTVERSTCVDKHVIVGASVKVKNMSDADLKVFKVDFPGFVELTNSVANVTVGHFIRKMPVLYAVLEGSIAKSYVCNQIDAFKEKLADKLILDDGVKKANPQQVVFQNHPCRGDQSELLRDMQFFISRNGILSEPDEALTNLAFKVVEQMIYDGTTWMLGLHLYKHLDSIELFGSAKKDPGLSDVQITYIGFGAVSLLIVLIVIVIKVVDYFTTSFGNDYDTEDYVGPSKGTTNTLFETEKEKSYQASENKETTFNVNPGYEEDHQETTIDGGDYYEEAADILTINTHAEPTFEVPPPPVNSPKYFESQEAYPYNNVNEAPLATNETEVIELQNVNPNGSKATVAALATDEINETKDHLYESVVDVKKEKESVSTGEELLPPPEFDSFSEDEDDFDEGKSIDWTGLYSMLEDENALLNEYKGLTSRVPDASLYPEGVIVKNRVSDYFPWPDNRVLLYVDQGDDPLADYINASFVKDNAGAIAYLSTQAPLESTTNNFWQMIWERNIAVIVMSTPLNLHGDELCHQYWPSDQTTQSYGDIVVELAKEEMKQDFHVATVNVSLSEKSRQVYLFRYTSWELDIPADPKAIVAFILEIRELCDSTRSLPIFHCSSGRGMAAVLIALINGMLSVEENNVVDMKTLVELLRKDIPAGIENIEQYKFLYQAMYQYAIYNAN